MVLDLNENLLVVDVQNKRVQIFDKDGNFINKFGSFGIGNGQFGYPSGIAVDSVGHIYVSDHASDRDRMFHE
jgi:DNA-binding beta-propeller fold protein YncE